MGFLDRLFGGGDDARRMPDVPGAAPRGDASSFRDGDGRYAPPPATAPARAAAPDAALTGDDARAIERYRYLLRTAPPETIEQVHAEAFGQLTDLQRQQVLADMSATLPASERPASGDPQALARAATRAEYREPGFMERTFGGRSFGGGQGGGFGSMLGASMLGTIGGYVIGSALVSSFMAPAFAADQGDPGGDGSSEAGPDASGADAGGWGGEATSDAGGFDGGGFGDVGGGDFGGFDGF